MSNCLLFRPRLIIIFSVVGVPKQINKSIAFKAKHLDELIPFVTQRHLRRYAELLHIRYKCTYDWHCVWFNSTDWNILEWNRIFLVFVKCGDFWKRNFVMTSGTKIFWNWNRNEKKLRLKIMPLVTFFLDILFNIACEITINLHPYRPFWVLISISVIFFSKFNCFGTS